MVSDLKALFTLGKQMTPLSGLWSRSTCHWNWICHWYLVGHNWHNPDIAGHTHDQISSFFANIKRSHLVSTSHSYQIHYSHPRSLSSADFSGWYDLLRAISVRCLQRQIQSNQTDLFCFLCCQPSLDWFLNLNTAQRGGLKQTTEVKTPLESTGANMLCPRGMRNQSLLLDAKYEVDYGHVPELSCFSLY